MNHESNLRKQDYLDLQNMILAECEYPGQTMLVALAVTLAFSSLGEAMSRQGTVAPLGRTYTNASCSSMVPGASCAVYKALNTLESGVRDKLDADEMLAKLHESWREYVEGTFFEDRYRIGLAKAQPFEKFFRQHWGIWRNISIEDQKLEAASVV